ncbi:hypothetical protein BC835DRAFT_1534514 [Cytidiella melzeri]|nr:hypothetical protein BC835DRAFT_1534514 [Cytidiella melzeri]
MVLSIFSRIKCHFPGCSKTCRKQSGLTKHVRDMHGHQNQAVNPGQRLPVPGDHAPAAALDDASSSASNNGQNDQPHQLSPPPCSRKIKHPHLTGSPCDRNGVPLAPGVQPEPRHSQEPGDWPPFHGGAEFLMADLLFHKVEMSAANQDNLYEILTALMSKHNAQSPFSSAKDMYSTIDAATVGDAPWQCFTTSFAGELGPNLPSWKLKEYEVWYCDPDVLLQNMLDNPDFAGEFDYSPYIHIDEKGHRRWTDFSSSNFAWRHCDDIYKENPEQNEGAMYCAVFTGSNKTVVSVGTGSMEYHPGYLSPGNVRNNVCRGHRAAVLPYIFLQFQILSHSERRYDNDPAFCKFKRQFYHASLSAVFQLLKQAMSVPVVRRCPDGHFRRVIFDFGPVAADYPEQVLLAGTCKAGMLTAPRCTALPNQLDTCKMRCPAAKPFTNDFPRADIHELLSPDLLHQIIKGTFKDHLVTWVGQYLELTHGKAQANIIMDDIDRRIAAVPTFPGLRRFPDGRRFKQWTGDDSKALMKVYLPALRGYVPSEIIKTFSSFLDFCYLVRGSSFTPQTLERLDHLLEVFHHYREVFRTSGVRPEGFSLPRQHSLTHYRRLIQEFGAPYGLCSSITESRHITAVKRPWRRSNRYNALGQMLITNQRLDKLAALRVSYVSRGMLPASHNTLAEDNDDDGGPVDEVVSGAVVLARRPARGYPSDLNRLADHINQPHFPVLLQRFLFDQLHPESPYGAEAVPVHALPIVRGTLSIFHSATATFYAPSDTSGRYGMYRERIRSTPRWHSNGPRRDCAFVVEDEDQPGFPGMSVVRIRLFFSFKHSGITYPCALVEWFNKFGQRPDPDTGMWVVKPDLRGQQDQPYLSVVHLDCLLRAAHLIPVFGRRPLPLNFSHTLSLDAFRAFFVNKYIDQHAHELFTV